ncbi:MAG: arsenite efflux transporter metallochaperone ArsD [Acidobacteria bacterium]|nr:arsenite efflux transporter metallochaperone ArsD [Acidobacteriota bacterium]
MRLIQVFEPPMCCSTGVCGPEADPVLAQFTADLDAVRSEHTKVERFNLSQSPHQFATTPAVLDLLRERGADVLPAVMVDGQIVHTGSYPDRAALMAFAGAAASTAPSTPSVIERARAALAEGRLVFLCMPNGEREAFLAPFREVAMNPGLGPEAEVIEVTGANDDERALLAEVGIPLDPQTSGAVLIAPPGLVTARWAGTPDAGDVLVRVLQSAARCAPGGGCC